MTVNKLTEALESQGTNRFMAYCMAMAGFVVLGSIAFWLKAPTELVDATFWPAAMYAAGYQGFGMAHDAVARTSLVRAISQITVAEANANSQDLPTQGATT